MPWNDIAKIRAGGPLIHNITNYVVMNTTANALLALGASPVMAHDLDEVEEMVGYAGALVLNIGTLSPRSRISRTVSYQLLMIRTDGPNCVVRGT